jgi:hypothetical protein
MYAVMAFFALMHNCQTHVMVVMSLMSGVAMVCAICFACHDCGHLLVFSPIITSIAQGLIAGCMYSGADAVS